MTRSPSPAIAARRRRVAFWIPLFILGSVAYLAATATVGFNSLAMAGAAALIAGVVGLASEVDK